MENNYLDLFVNWLKENQSFIHNIPAGVTIRQRIITTDKPGQTVDIELLNNNVYTGYITIWETGECDMEGVSYVGNNSFWRHFDFTSAAEVYTALQAYFQDIATLSEAPNEEEETLDDSPRVAIVNNETDISRLIERYLHENRCTTTIINPSQEADFIVFLRLFSPNLIVLKISPLELTRDPYRTCQEIRSDALLANTPIIMISTNEQRAFQAGATSWFDIVFRIDELHRKIQTLID